MRRVRPRAWFAVLGAIALIATACPERDDEAAAYVDPGISDTEIVFGSSNALSGPASAYGVISRSIEAYFNYLNQEEGGVEMTAFDGQRRQIRFEFLDDGYEPQRTLDNTRRLVEQDQVFGMFQTLGTPPNTAIREYLNEREVPQLFVATGASTWGANHDQFPWTIGWQPAYPTESAAYVDFLNAEHPGSTIAVLFQNDDYGRDYLNGFEAALAGTDHEIIAQQSYEVADPSVDPQVTALADSGAEVFFNITTPAFAAQAIRRNQELGWEPIHLLNNVSASVAAVLEPAGLDASQGLITASYLKDPSDPQWDDDPAVAFYKEKLGEYAPDLDPNDPFNLYGFAVGETLVRTIEQMEEPTREALMESARTMDFRIDLLLPGVQVRTGPDDYFPIEAMQMHRVEGDIWVAFGDVFDFTGDTMQFVE